MSVFRPSLYHAKARSAKPDFAKFEKPAPLPGKPAVNLLLYLAPALSLCWLPLWQKVDVANLWLVGLGTLMVTLADILSHFRHPHPRHHHQPLTESA